ncbi:Elongation factor [Thalictrum thalictroides]|uniref:Elongation factor n=1 Tax=Thalictrum thalictroides TaxID=46969 RepID=A0A7J6XDF7_THATH|nr:Elongation factor [Thalictrum thalictroides]
MTPSQVSIDQVKETKSEVAVKALERKEDVSLRCVSNCEDTTFDMEPLSDRKPMDVCVVEEKEIDIVGCTDENDFRLGQEGDETEGTEYSSSFGNNSGNEDDSILSDSEVDSIYSDSNFFEECMFGVGKKKVTSQWRRYISPLSWRGKWLELKMRELKSQILKYDRELASYGQRQQPLEFGQCTSEDLSVKELPFCGERHKKNFYMKRKKRKVEEMVDVSSFMTHHNLFSYYENKKSDPDGASVDDDFGIQVIAADFNSNEDFDNNYACPSLEFRDENSLEHVLWKIGVLQSRVQKLKTQTDTLITLHAGKFSSVESLSHLVQSDLPSSSPGSPALSSGNAERVPSGALSTPPRHIADPGSAVSSYGEATPQPDIIESCTVPLSGEVRLDQSYLGESCQNTADKAVLHKQEVKKEPQEFEKVSGPDVVKPLENVKEEKLFEVPITGVDLKPELSQEAKTAQDNSILKTSYASEFHGPSTKGKRGERKASSGTWKC